MPRNSFLAAVYLAPFSSRCANFQICRNIRGTGTLRQAIFDGHFVSQSDSRRRRDLRAGGKRLGRKELSRVELPKQVLPPLNSPMGSFFGVDPKKSRALLLCRSALCPTTERHHPWPRSHKRGGEKDLEESAGNAWLRLSAPGALPSSDFFWVD